MKSSFENNFIKIKFMEHIKKLKAWSVLSDWKNIYVVYRANRKTPDYSLPKWHCEDWETFEETAYRETLEETWIKWEILWEIKTIYYNYEENWLINDSEVHYFAMKVKETWNKEFEDDVTTVYKFPIEKVEEHLTFENDKIVIRKWKELYNKK